MKKIIAICFVCFLASTLIVGCDCTGKPKDLDPKCTEDLLCVDGWECKDGECVDKECKVDADCEAYKGRVCKDGKCVAGKPSGDTCKTDTDCPAGQKCNTDTKKCEKTTSSGCEKDSDCPAGTKCVDKKCTSTSGTGCKFNSDCASGQTCNTSTGKCESSSTGCVKAGCPSGQVCNTSTGKCETQSSTCEDYLYDGVCYAGVSPNANKVALLKSGYIRFVGLTSRLNGIRCEGETSGEKYWKIDAWQNTGVRKYCYPVQCNWQTVGGVSRCTLTGENGGFATWKEMDGLELSNGLSWKPTPRDSSTKWVYRE